MSKKKHYRSVFISDVHLGCPLSKTDRLLDFLDGLNCRYLYICGDFIDFYHLYEHHGWSKMCNLLIRKILSKVRKGTEVKICIGNHDAFLGIVSGYKFGDVSIDHQFIHKGSFIDYLVVHGDKFDRSLKLTSLSKIASFFQSHLHWLPGMSWIKRFVHWVSDRNIDKNEMLKYASSYGVDAVICGHTHLPVIDKQYMNCGDWMDHCTALVEDEDGHFDLVSFKE